MTTTMSMKKNKDSYNMSNSVQYKVENNVFEIKNIVQNAAQYLSPVWPLETFIACNPLQGFEELAFEEALVKAGGLIKKSEKNIELEDVNLQMIKWCGSFFDAGQCSIDMPYKDKGFYFGFLKLACFDKTLHKNNKELKKWLINLPDSPEQAISFCLRQLDVRIGKEEDFITQTLLHLPGWAGYLKWKTQWHNPLEAEENPVTLTEFTAVRLVITCLLWPDAASQKKPQEDLGLVKKVMERLKNSEDKYSDKLLKTLLPELKKPAGKIKRPDAQLVFCIDVRSEPFRRMIEKVGNYETLGFAGFYGLPIRVKDYDSERTKDCCPVLLKPRYNIDEEPQRVNKIAMKHYQQGRKIKTTLAHVYQQLKYNFSTPFALVESMGVWYGMWMLLKSMSPNLYKNFSQSLGQVITPNLETKPSFELDMSDLEKGISLSEQVAYGETVLRLMGLTSNFAKLVILCGHGSSTENNPYASALDCGACGGNHGGVNAKLLAAILNKPEVRKAIEEKGIHIPLDTVFYGALHNTTTDGMEIYPLQNNEVIYPEVLNQLIIDLNEAKVNNNSERSQKLNCIDIPKSLEKKSQDWSETRPEWGLARNAAFIVAPRTLTKNINLDGRAFLHSYDWKQDYDGSLLETILTAPMVVAEWINTQYLFSTLDNISYGSGSKITHNVTGKIGIMQGNGSDLMHGLPLQSVMSNDETRYHDPQRLLSIVYAPRKTVMELISKQDILKKLFFNEWVQLIVIEPNENLSYRLSKDGEWVLTK
ncbi:MAG: DUF2309 domain-containing protein [Legionellaceae bacterium]|nr:DUF2309 domain-containing protein [Legionellaceae bacterium]